MYQLQFLFRVAWSERILYGELVITISYKVVATSKHIDIRLEEESETTKNLT
jgi:hypothetical protein